MRIVPHPDVVRINTAEGVPLYVILSKLPNGGAFLRISTRADMSDGACVHGELRDGVLTSGALCPAFLSAINSHIFTVRKVG